MGNEASRCGDSGNGKMGKSAAGARVTRKRILAHLGNDNVDPPTYPKTDEKICFLKESLSNNFLYECLDEDERELFIHALEEETIERGVDVVKQGDTGDYFYVIEKGRIVCYVDGKKTNTFSPGSCFGELSLLYDSPRTATCRTITQATLWKINHDIYRNVIASSERKKKDAIIDVLKKVHFLSLLDDAHLNKLVDVLIPITCSSGTQIIKKGEIGKQFFIIKEGSVKIHDIGVGNSEFTDREISAGEHFGELALQSGKPRQANVTAMTDCSMLYLTRADFQRTIGDYDDLLKKAFRRQTLRSAPVFATAELEIGEINQLASLFEEKTFEQDERLAKIGDVVSNPGFCIIEEGMVRISGDDGTITDLIKGDHFGGNTIKLADEYTSERNIRFINRTKLAVLSKRSIESVIFSTERLGKPQKFERELEAITLEDLNHWRIIGGGGFATVRLVTRRNSFKPYALKIISKRTIINENKIKNIIRERNIIASMVHFTFVINLVATFQDSLKIYFLFDFIQGGEMFNIIYSKDEIIKGKTEALFYSSCILLCLMYFSDRFICYRDLKPENILIDQSGYCVLIDFGEAKVVSDKTYTVCGAPEYMAPEVILCKGHNYTADYWSFGVYIYEILAKKTPFYESNIENTTLFKKIVKVKYTFPENGAFTDDTKDLIKQLLVKKPHKRLGNLAIGARGIAKHAFFEGMDWKQLYPKKLKAPWLPKVKGEMDPSNYDVFPEKENREEKEEEYLTEEEQAIFDDFKCLHK